ncbi:protein bric-a-brac 1 isoform X3 [Anabrus simplex]|uniref:protein bric-a-brac 1 isoform X3 n=1 Tax=Anabrus simplex TaxID=316456 RepID=UPI0035A31F41
MAEVDSEQFSLRWNNFHNNLTTGFHSLLEEEDLVDVTLAADGQFVQAHRIVLSVCSPYFKQLFKANPCKHPIVILKDVCHKELEAILQFMYQGEVNVRQEELATFLKTAEMLQIKGLTGHDTQENSSPAPVPNPVHRPVREREKPPVSEPAIVKQEDQLPRPYKRPRTEPAPVSSIVPISTPTHNPVPVPPPVSPRPSSDDSSRAEFVEITNPKTEPVDYGSDIEEVIETKHPSREDPLVQLLQGESSQSHVDTSQGPAPGLFASIPGLPQDSGGSQDGVQAWMPSPPQLLCPLCDREFVNKFNLKVHIRDKHSSDRGPYSCPLCGKQVKNQSCLRVHLYQQHRKKEETTPVLRQSSQQEQD